MDYQVSRPPRWQAKDFLDASVRDPASGTVSDFGVGAD
jgi:hypothetical protein